MEIRHLFHTWHDRDVVESVPPLPRTPPWPHPPHCARAAAVWNQHPLNITGTKSTATILRHFLFFDSFCRKDLQDITSHTWDFEVENLLCPWEKKTRGTETLHWAKSSVWKIPDFSLDVQSQQWFLPQEFRLCSSCSGLTFFLLLQMGVYAHATILKLQKTPGWWPVRYIHVFVQSHCAANTQRPASNPRQQTMRSRHRVYEVMRVHGAPVCNNCGLEWANFRKMLIVKVPTVFMANVFVPLKPISHSKTCWNSASETVSISENAFLIWWH